MYRFVPLIHKPTKATIVRNFSAESHQFRRIAAFLYSSVYIVVLEYNSLKSTNDGAVFITDSFLLDRRKRLEPISKIAETLLRDPNNLCSRFLLFDCS